MMKKSIIVMLVFLLLSVTVFATSAFADDYVLCVGGVEVTSENASDIFEDSTVSYDEASSTLYLKDANLSTPGVLTKTIGDTEETFYCFIYAEQSLKVVVDGISTISGGYAFNLQNDSVRTIYGVMINGDGRGKTELVFDGYGGDDSNLSIELPSFSTRSACVYAYGADVAVKNSVLRMTTGYVTATHFGLLSKAVANENGEEFGGNVYFDFAGINSTFSSTQYGSTMPCYTVGLYAKSLYLTKRSSVSFSGATIYSAYGNGYSVGIYVEDSIEVHYLSNLSGSSNFVSTHSTVDFPFTLLSYGVVTGENLEKVVVDEYSKLNAQASDVSISDEKLHLSQNSESVGFKALGDNCVIYIDGFSEVSANSYDSDAVSLGAELYGIEIGDGKFSAGCSSLNMLDSWAACKMASAPSDDLHLIYYNDYSETYTYSPDLDTFIDKNGKVSHHVTITSYDKPVNSGYVLYVGGIRVTEDNADDVFGDGSVRYDAETSTLYLTDATITDGYCQSTHHNEYSYTYIFSSIHFEQDLNIVLEGENTIDSTHDVMFSQNYGIYGTGTSSKPINLTINGSGDDVLNIRTGDVTRNTTGINVNYGNITINNARINIETGESLDADDFDGSSDSKTAGIAVSTSSNISGKIVISDSEINVDCGKVTTSDSGTSHGIVGFDITITDESSVIVNAGEILSFEDNSSASYGISASVLKIEKKSVVEAGGGNVYCECDSEGDSSYSTFSIGVSANLIIDDATLNVRGGDIISDDDAINYSAGCMVSTVTMDNGAVINAESNNANTYSAGVISIAGGVVNSGTIISTANCDNEGCLTAAILSMSEIVGLVARDGATGERLVYSPSSYSYVTSNGTPSTNVSAGDGTALVDIVYVGGVLVTEENASDIFGDGTASYNFATNTLTLNNADITESYMVEQGVTAAIYTEVPINIVVNGTNTITTGTEGSYGEAAIAYYGPELPEGENAITIIGNSKEDVLNVATSDTYLLNALILSTTGNIEFKDVTVNADGGDTGESAYGVLAGINGLSDIIIDGADVNVALGNVSSESGADVYGTFCDDLVVKNNGKLDVTVGNINSSDLATVFGVMTDGDLTVTGNSSVNVSGGDITTSDESAGGSIYVGVYVMGDAVIDDNSEVEAESGNISSENPSSGDMSCGFYSDGSVTIDGGSTLTGVGGDANGASVGAKANSFDVLGGALNGTTLATSTPLAAGISSDNEIEGVDIRDSSTGKEAVFDGEDGALPGYKTENGEYIKSVTAASVVYYNVFVGSNQVTSVNMSDILGDGTVSYNPETFTLTLNNATVNGFVTDIQNGAVYNYGICSTESVLNVYLVGNNTLTVENVNGTKPDVLAGLGCMGNLNIYGENSATLDVSVADSNAVIYGIASYNELSVSGDVTVTVNTGNIVYGAVYAENTGIFVVRKFTVNDKANVYSYSGGTMRAEGYGKDGYTGSSVAIMVSGEMEVNTSGIVYGYSDSVDSMAAGIAVLSELFVNSGKLVGHVRNDAPATSLVAAVDIFTEPNKVNVLAGPSADELYNAQYVLVSPEVGGTYFYDANYTFPYYVVITPGMGSVENLEIETTADGKTLVSVVIDGYEDALVVFSSYESNGRMIDVKGTVPALCDENGKLTVELDLTDAAKVKAFVFESLTSVKPVCENLEIDV